MDDLKGTPVCIELTMPADLLEHTFTLDTDNYPVIGGTDPALLNKTVKVSSIAMIIANAGDVIGEMKIDDQVISKFPYTKAVPATGDYQVINMLAIFGKSYIPLRSTFKYTKSNQATATAKILIFGIATPRTV